MFWQDKMAVRVEKQGLRQINTGDDIVSRGLFNKWCKPFPKRTMRGNSIHVWRTEAN